MHTTDLEVDEPNGIIEPRVSITIDDLRTLLRRGTKGVAPELATLPLTESQLIGLLPYLTPAERVRLERLMPRTREEAVVCRLDETVGEQESAFRCLSDSELLALCALVERLSPGPLLLQDVPQELRGVWPETAENERWIAAINAIGEKFARGEDLATGFESVTIDLSRLTSAELQTLHALRWKLAGMQPELSRAEHEARLERINVAT